MKNILFILFVSLFSVVALADRELDLRIRGLERVVDAKKGEMDKAVATVGELQGKISGLRVKISEAENKRKEQGITGWDRFKAVFGFGSKKADVDKIADEIDGYEHEIELIQIDLQSAQAELENRKDRLDYYRERKGLGMDEKSYRALSQATEQKLRGAKLVENLAKLDLQLETYANRVLALERVYDYGLVGTYVKQKMARMLDKMCSLNSQCKGGKLPRNVRNQTLKRMFPGSSRITDQSRVQGRKDGLNDVFKDGKTPKGRGNHDYENDFGGSVD